MTDAAKPKRVLAVASGGGHWVQLRRLAPALRDFDVAYVSVQADYAEGLDGQRFYAVTDITRRNPGAIFRLAPQLIRILLKERPDVVITTGALPGLATLALARIFTSARTVWIDSIANCEQLSSSGRTARFFAHEWLTQWPDIASESGPHYWGAVL